MKKIITIVIMFLAIITLAAAPEGDTALTVATKIGGVTGLKISQENPITDWSTEGLIALGDYLTKEPLENLFVNLRTNKRISIAVHIDAPHMSNKDTMISYQISYVVTPDPEVEGVTVYKPVHSGIEAVNVPLVIFHGNLSAGMRIVSHGFSIDIDDDDYDNAIEGEYRATIQFNIVVGS